MQKDLLKFAKENLLDKKPNTETKELFATQFKQELKDSQIKILDILLPYFTDKEPILCFKLIYDIEKYADTTINLLNEYLKSESLTTKELLSILKLAGSKDIFYESIINYDISFKNLTTIFDYTINFLDKDFLEFFLTNNGFYLRKQFIEFLIKNYPSKLPQIIPNIITAISSDDRFFKMDDLCEILTYLSLNNENKKEYEELKNFVLDIYPKNNLAKNLLQVNNEKYLLNDLDTLFLTSKDYKVEIFKKYEKNLSEEIALTLKRNYALFKNTPTHLEKIYTYDLDKTLTALIDKYLSLSKNTSITYLTKGTTAAVYRVGDYCLKLILGKHNNADSCPNLYLINKCYYEELVRDDYQVVAGLEVQKYLPKKLFPFDFEQIKNFKKLLKDEGYYIDDTIKANFRYLNSYKEADTTEVESLPRCFKKKPLVLIDRDSIYKLPKKNN